jgi:hypothetical protein
MPVTGAWARRRGGSARDGAHTSADRCTDARTAPATCDRTDDSSGAGTNQTAAYRAISRIIRVSEGRGREHQPRADHAGKCRLLSHPFLTENNSRCYRANE